MSTRLLQVDAFSDTAFAGNPAAVVLLERPRETPWMQKVAQEMNLSETAFLVERDGVRQEIPEAAREHEFDLRWFTPEVEVDLCGHATLASAHTLWEEGRLEPDAPARFHTRSGLLTARRRGEWIEMDFPTRPEKRIDPPEGLLEALGVTADYVGRNVDDYVVLIDSERALRSLEPDIRRLKSLHVRGVVVTCKSETPGFDFVSRFFAPGSGIDEDPVTGSAHCCLGPFWQERLGRSEFTAFQASARGGVVRVRVEGERVLLGGQAVSVLRGELVA